jgi:hypothetical protein
LKNVELPEEIELTQSQKITNVKKFIAGHLAVVRANMNKNTFSSFYERLIKLKDHLQK